MGLEARAESASLLSTSSSVSWNKGANLLTWSPHPQNRDHLLASSENRTDARYELGECIALHLRTNMSQVNGIR